MAVTSLKMALLRLLLVFLFSQSSSTAIIVMAMSVSQSSQFHHRVVPSFGGVGVTSITSVPILPSNSPSSSSLHVDDNEYDQYYVGTKRGRVVQIGLPPPSSFSISSVQIHDILSGDNLDNDAKRGDVKLASKPYPIFSLMCVLQNGCDDEEEDGNDYELLAGGADRYVTVRRRKRKHQDEGSQLHSRGSWSMEEHLGPHTGWVKDMAMIKMRQKKASDDRRVFLFSIGCNCIEVWSRNGGNYQHMHKLKIESSVQMGSTLSSDILCLATASISKLNNRDDCSDGTIDGTINLLLAGGVDGRMHLWTMTTTKSETVHGNASIIFNCVGSISAHQGRVNAIAVCPVMNVVISVGNDSSIHCRQITSSLLLSSWETRIINLAVDHEGEIIAVEEDDSESSTRRGLKITSLCIVDETARQSTIAIGTSCGRLALIDITLSEIRINDCIMTQLRDTMKLDVETDEDGKEDEVVIHALCAGRRYDDIQRILVGHARGLTVWNVSIGTP